MPTLVTPGRWAELAAGFTELERVLREEGGEHLLPGVRSINRLLSTRPADEGDADRAVGEARSIYKTLLGRKELLADFFIWRDEFDERQRVNEAFTALVDRLGLLLANEGAAAG